MNALTRRNGATEEASPPLALSVPPILRLSLLLALLALRAGPAAAADPLAIMRAYCQADGRGDRLAASTWSAVAPLVAWNLEPAWDRLHLIRGLEIGTPQRRDDVVDIDVKYTLFADVSADGVRRADRIESRRYVLEPSGERGWRLRGPPPPPYIFETQADAAALAALLSPDDPAYLSNSAFVWNLLHDAGWEIAHSNTADLPSAAGYTSERTANVGDLVLYYVDGTPYHVGMVESDDAVVSSTLNGGIRRTPFGAFAGEIRYLRPAAGPPSAPTASGAADATPPAR